MKKSRVMICFPMGLVKKARFSELMGFDHTCHKCRDHDILWPLGCVHPLLMLVVSGGD